MRFEGRMISPGKARGEVLVIPEPLSFLGGVDGATGDVRVGDGGNVAGKVLVFPRGKGSTVGSFVMYDLAVHGRQPAAVINESAETIVATGAVISSIPMIDSIPSIGIFRNGDTAVVDAEAGTVDIEGVEMRESVSSVLFDGERLLMLKRPERCHSFPGRWSLVAGRVEEGEEPADTARREIMEETGISVGEPDGSLPPVYTREGATLWKVYPFLFRVKGAEPVLNEENVAFRWVLPEEVSALEHVDGTPEVVARLLGRSRGPHPSGSEPDRASFRTVLRAIFPSAPLEKAIQHGWSVLADEIGGEERREREQDPCDAREIRRKAARFVEHEERG